MSLLIAISLITLVAISMIQVTEAITMNETEARMFFNDIKETCNNPELLNQTQLNQNQINACAILKEFAEREGYLQEPKGRLTENENQSNNAFTDPCSPLNLVLCEID